MVRFKARFGAFEVSVDLSEYTDGEMRPAVWINDEMLDPETADAFAETVRIASRLARAGVTQ